MSDTTRPGQSGSGTTQSAYARPGASSTHTSAAPRPNSGPSTAAPGPGGQGAKGPAYDPDKTQVGQVPDGIYGANRPTGSRPAAPSAQGGSRPGGPSATSAPAAGARSQASGQPGSAASASKETGAVSGAVSGAIAAVKASARTTRRTRKARLRLSRIDPWSVMKTSLLFGIAGGIIFFVAIWVLWSVLGAAGTLNDLNDQIKQLTAGANGESKFDLFTYMNTKKVLGFSAMIAAADVVIFTALATLFSFLYNLSATVLGGLEVTLAED